MSDEIREGDLEVSPIRASGPGGQHRNTRETGIRLRHLPTGITVTATERRSQAENRRIALKRLEAALARLRRKRRRRTPSRPTRASVERRLASKKQRSEVKSSRKKVNPRSGDE